MNFQHTFEGACRGKECQTSREPRKVGPYPLAALVYRCNRCWKKEFSADQVGPTVQNYIKETGDVPRRPVLLKEKRVHVQEGDIRTA